ncbi:hypothetical protein [Myroides sp. N17-2]|uniref:hypothetical protein n=1 Tax=Myroides sp. N17-2 TaxID=2030799 RepID=UPI000EFD616E|nr:hypothetical protein [Myroides sp. N17-2]
MRTIIFFYVITFSSWIYSQKLTPENYYDFYKTINEVKGDKLTTAWLNKKEAAEILVEEMEKAGFEWVNDFRIVKLEQNDYIIAICYSEKSNVGFVYEETHTAFPNKLNRQLRSLYKKSTGNDYAEKIIDIYGESVFIKIKELPNNIKIIKEDIYWYQQTDNDRDNDYVVTKKDMLEIFRNDVRNHILNFKK